MNSATIPLAALATFTAVYWLTPGPAVRAAPEPAAIVEAPAAEEPADAALPAAGAATRSSRTQAPKRPRSRTARPHRAAAASAHASAPVRRDPEIYFSGCNAVRAAGLAPLYRGRPGYRPEMDGDDDGIACEPHRGRRRW